MIYDAVLTFHTNPYGCGVAKFNQQLAERLGVPCQSLSESVARTPLISIKPAELEQWDDTPTRWDQYDLFLHGAPRPMDAVLVQRARRVFAANGVIADALAALRPDVIVGFCPSTIIDSPASGIQILTFGMAGKLRAEPYQRLYELLEAHGMPYTMDLSCAAHEGASWEQTIGEASERLATIFGDRLRVLGFLADAALTQALLAAYGVALFFDPAVRANNTTFWAALGRSVPVITNLDAWSPPELKHDVNVWDIGQLSEWPRRDQKRIVRYGARVVAHQYSWDRLLEVLR